MQPADGVGTVAFVAAALLPATSADARTLGPHPGRQVNLSHGIVPRSGQFRPPRRHLEEAVEFEEGPSEEGGSEEGGSSERIGKRE